MKILYLHVIALDAHKANVLQALHMCNAFSKQGHEVILAVPEGNSPVEPESLAKSRLGTSDIGFKITTYKMKPFFGRFKATACIKPSLKIAKETEFDFIFLRHYILLPFLAKDGYNIVFESHYYYITKKINKILYSILEYLVIRVAKRRNFKVFIAISRNLENYWLKKGIPADKAMVAHDGVDLGMFDKVNDLYETKKSLGLPLDKKIIAYAGSTRTDRNIKQILKLAAEFEDALFVIIGEPSIKKKENDTTDFLFTLSNIKFTGYLSQAKVAEYISSADVLLMLWSKYIPTLEYCSPLKLFEYMAAGRIIVGHHLPSITEVIQDGVHAYLVDPDSFMDLRKAFIKALNEGYPSKMAQKAKELAKQYTWDIRADKIIKFYKYRTNKKAN